MDVNERRARATQEATQWWNRLSIDRAGEVSRGDRELFTQWLRESPLHVAELLRIAHVHDALERFKLWSEVETDGAAADSLNVIPLHEASDGSVDVVPGRSPATNESDHVDAAGTHRPRRTMWAIAASLCFLAVLSGWLVLANRGQVIQTELAERRQVMLDDGTVVQLEPETTLRVSFEEHERRVVLERGRALFRVTKDAQRPFLVHTGDTSVRAVGTAFGVERGTRGVVVTVAEGKVAVGSSKRNAPASVPADERNDTSIPAGARRAASGSSATVDPQGGEVFLTAGQQLTVHSSGAVDEVHSVDTTRALAWAQGRLVFENDTLADVVSVFNRYNRTQLRVSDAHLAARRVSGVFEATDLDTLLAFIGESGGDITITHSDAQIVIGSRSP